MYLIHGRMALALGLSTVAHAGLVWMIGEHLPSSAVPAQRAMTVAMIPAAPRAVLNSIAPSATAVVSPAAVNPIAPATVPVIDEPDSVVAARVVDTVEMLDAPPVQSRGPEQSPRVHDAPKAVVAAVTPRADVQVTEAAHTNAVDKPLPEALHAASAARSRVRTDTASRRTLASAPAREVVDGDPGSGALAHAVPAVAGQPGAERSAVPAAGNEPPEYPWAARLQGHEGRVVLSVWVSAEGEAEALSVLQSSGYAMLDRAAAEAVERWRFQPARRAGNDTPSMLYVPVVFRLDGDSTAVSPSRPAAGTRIVNAPDADASARARDRSGGANR